MLENPFAILPRPQAPATPPSKHKAGRTKPLSAKERKRARAERMREVRQRISETLDAKAIQEALDGPGA